MLQAGCCSSECVTASQIPSQPQMARNSCIMRAAQQTFSIPARIVTAWLDTSSTTSPLPVYACLMSSQMQRHRLMRVPWTELLHLSYVVAGRSSHGAICVDGSDGCQYSSYTSPIHGCWSQFAYLIVMMGWTQSGMALDVLAWSSPKHEIGRVDEGDNMACSLHECLPEACRHRSEGISSADVQWLARMQRRKKKIEELFSSILSSPFLQGHWNLLQLEASPCGGEFNSVPVIYHAGQNDYIHRPLFWAVNFRICKNSLT